MRCVRCSIWCVCVSSGKVFVLRSLQNGIQVMIQPCTFESGTFPVSVGSAHSLPCTASSRLHTEGEEGREKERKGGGEERNK